MTVTLGSKAVGSIVKLKENGILQNYIVVHQGLPSDIYDSSCNGTWLLRQDCIEERAWYDGSKNIYESSDIYYWLNSTMLNKYDADIQNLIKQVKIPYRKNGGSEGIDKTGVNGLSCKIFLLSSYELGWTKSDNSYFPIDGAKLDYFEYGTGMSANSKRIAKLNGSAKHWWLRSPNGLNNYESSFVYSEGYYSNNRTSNSYGVRPAFVLPSSLWVVDDGSVVTNTAPTTPLSITVPDVIIGGKSLNISWGASTDAQGDIIKYELERSVNSGTSWTKIYE